jgi:KaiC/GvpD/RAD55 family RecA-like ATPase
MRPSESTRELAPESAENGRSTGARERRGYFGIEGLDDLVPDGIGYDEQVMVEGDTGIGKSVLAAQFLYEGLMVGDTCVYIACDEPPNKMRLTMAGFRMGTIAHERAGKLIFVDAYARDRSSELYSIPDPTSFDELFLYQKRFVEKAAQSGPVRLVVDSLSTIMVQATPAEIVGFNSTRLRYLRSRNVLTLDTVTREVLDERTANRLRHSYPMIVNLRYVTTEGRVQRFIQLGKLKSGMFQATQHLYAIDPRTGLVVQRRTT